jgi:malonyl CoA-acyl carrier protein transacylase
MDCGIEVMYIAPDEALLRLALKAGIHYIILEGYEAGGHVGAQSTLTLAQMVLGLKNSDPSLFKNCRVILAGGIFNRETAFMAAMLGADAIQMGTAYLSCREIIETGALTPLYQRMILTSPLAGTIVSGQSAGLRVRSLKTPVTEAILSLEREFAAGHRDETSFRKQMETMAAGSLFTAARGMEKPGSMPLDERACLERGQFMSGACVGLIRDVHDLSSFHRELSQGTFLLYQGDVNLINASLEPPAKRTERSGRQIISKRKDRDRIAITGMSIVNTLGNSPEDVWAASLAMKSGITQVPPSRWDQARFYDPRPHSQDKTYCKVGAFLDFHVDRNELGISPHDFRSMTEATRVTLWLADKAIRESGILLSNIPRERIAVLVSQNSGEASGMLTNTLIRAYVNDIIANIKRAVALSPEQERAIEQEIKTGRMAPDDTTLLGRLNCAAVGFICSRYGFMGPSHAVSAACATSLVALHSAVQMLKTGLIDAAVIGGGEENLSRVHFMEFSALGALYGLSGKQKPAHETSCPFDAQRDGMVLGEGGAMIVIERESFARARGARIHAIVTGVGASNSHQGMVESASDAQQMAIRASFKETPYGPDAVDLVECHATSTRQGDAQEALALKAVFNSSKPTMLSAFKSQIGHTLGASGISSLIRGVTAMKAEIFPPTLNYKHPDPEINLERSGFIVTPEALDWKRRNGEPRRLEVNAFGFGGSNYVVQVEEAMEESDTILVAQRKTPDLLRDPAEDRTKPLASGLPVPGDVLMFRTAMDNRNFRTAAVGQSKEQALSLIRESVSPGEVDIVLKKDLIALARKGIFMQREDLPVLPLAFVFPGQGTHYAGMGHDLYRSFPVIREWMDRAAAVADFDLLHLMFHDQEKNLRKTRWQQPALFAMETAMARYFFSLGIRPVAMAGHSLGELTALCMAGVYSLEDGFKIVNKRALCMDKAAAANIDPGIMAATDAPMDLLDRMRKGCDDIHIGNINSPNQIVLSGSTESVRDFCSRLKEMGHRTTLLRVSMAFHSPVMKVIHDELAAFIAQIPFHSPRIPVISNTTRMPYPSDPKAIKKILMSHLESTVHWMDNVQTLWNNHGVRLFVEVGPGDVISDLVADTLAESTNIQTCLSSEESLTMKRGLAKLFVHGHLTPERQVEIVSLSVAKKAAASDTIEHAPILPSVASQPVASQSIESGHLAPDPRERIFQREINRFMMAKFGSFLEPNMLNAFRQELDPSFQEDDLSRVITSMLTGSDLVESPLVQIPPVADEIPESGLVPEDQGVMETLIHIIMDATGFNRNEIEPDMDLRRDLSIRSSRLPVIMDAAERQFNIVVELEDFIDVHTVKDIARTISRIMAGPAGSVPKPPALTLDPDALHEDTLKQKSDDDSLKRLVFTRTAVKLETSVPIELNPGASVMILSSDSHDTIAEKAGNILRTDYNVSTSLMDFLQSSAGPGRTGHDIRTDKGALQAQDTIAGLPSVSGLVITLSPGGSVGKISMADVSRVVRGFFLVVKAFLRSVNKKFVVLVHSGQDNDIPQGMVAEGMLGLFLSAALEYPSVQFRTMEIALDTDLGWALACALDRGRTVVEMMHRKQEVFTSEACLAPLEFSASPDLNSGLNLGLNLNPGDVVVMSGGATGISAHLARCLAPFAPHLVFLGRTIVNSGFTPAASNPEPASKAFIVETRASEIARTLAELHTSGIKATYHTCDVTDPAAVKRVLGEVVTRYGRIDGIIHSAGVLRDSLLSHMTPDDVSRVMDVKFLGAWNLFSAAKDAGLRFFVGLSSAAAIQGNPGQANYAAANRMMSALLRTLGRENSDIRFKAMMLPPVEGAGMAGDPQVKAMMNQKGVAYIHVNELTGLFCRELFAAPAKDTCVMFMKRQPQVSGAMLNDRDRPSPAKELDTSIGSFRPGNFPMIETIVSLGLCQEELEALRCFSLDKDLWITDHRPFKFIKHAIVSGTMILETFMEAARILYPHLQVRGVRKVRLMDMIQCPPGIPRPARISCRRSGGLREPVCDVFLAAQEISPAGRLTDRFTPQCSGQVILDGGEGYLGEAFLDFPVRMNELRTRPMDHKKVLKWYKDRSGLGGRYRVIEFLDGAGPRVVRGRTTYPETNDFASLHNPTYQYPPYLFEALLQLVCCHSAATDPSERRSMIPMEIEEMRFLRKIEVGEKITLEARMRAQDDKGFTWDTRGLDDQGRTLMQIYGLRMQWVSD